GAPTARLAGDGHPAFARDASGELTGLRLALSGPEQDELRDLGADAATALEGALAAWSPGQRDLDVQARVAASLEGCGADAPVLIVGGDDRVRRYRHPMAVGAPVSELVMAVVVARRAGLHAAATGPARAAGPGGPDRAGRAGGEPPGGQLRAGTERARRGLRARGRRGRVGGPLPGRPDRLRPARVRDRPVPARF